MSGRAHPTLGGRLWGLPEPAGRALESTSQGLGFSHWDSCGAASFTNRGECVCIMCIWVRKCPCLTATSWAMNDDKRLPVRTPSVFSHLWFCVRLACLCTCLCRSGCSGREWLCRSGGSSDCGRYRWTGCYSERGSIKNKSVRKSRWGRRVD